MSLQNSKIAEQSVTAVFHDFEVNRVLSENDRSKTIAVLGRSTISPNHGLACWDTSVFESVAVVEEFNVQVAE